MAGREVYLVGSVPFSNAREVFEKTSAALGELLPRIPDGETGARLDWINALEPVFQDSPFLERADEAYLRSSNPNPNFFRYQLRDGFKIADVQFDNLPDAQIANDSYREFSRLKKEGKIGAGVKYQTQLVTAFSIIRRFIVERQQAEFEPLYAKALQAEQDKICSTIPHHELALQWDIASGVFERLERGQPNRFGANVVEMMETFTSQAANYANLVPADIDLILHLCYGDNQHKHTIEPSSSRLMVDFANLVSQKIKRSIQLIHMPVPRYRLDDDYYMPLRDLKLKPGTEIALGLIHHTDGVEGSMSRAKLAMKYLPDFQLATECGWGRRDPSTIPELMKIHREVAARL